jgi:hypothetical protein
MKVQEGETRPPGPPRVLRSAALGPPHRSGRCRDGSLSLRVELPEGAFVVVPFAAALLKHLPVVDAARVGVAEHRVVTVLVALALQVRRGVRSAVARRAARGHRRRRDRRRRRCSSLLWLLLRALGCCCCRSRRCCDDNDERACRRKFTRRGLRNSPSLVRRPPFARLAILLLLLRFMLLLLALLLLLLRLRAGVSEDVELLLELCDALGRAKVARAALRLHVDVARGKCLDARRARHLLCVARRRLTNRVSRLQRGVRRGVAADPA